MSNIYKAFENKKAFIPFVTGGDPDLETTKNLLIAMEKAGADSYLDGRCKIQSGCTASVPQ